MLTYIHNKIIQETKNEIIFHIISVIQATRVEKVSIHCINNVKRGTRTHNLKNFKIEEIFGTREVAQQLRGPKFESQHPHGDPQLSVTSILRDLMPSSGLYSNYMYMVDRHKQDKHPYTQKNEKLRYDERKIPHKEK